MDRMRCDCVEYYSQMDQAQEQEYEDDDAIYIYLLI